MAQSLSLTNQHAKLVHSKLYEKPGIQNFYIKQVKSNESNEIMFRRFGDFMKLLTVIHEKRIGYMNRKLKEYVLLLPNLLLVL